LILVIFSTHQLASIEVGFGSFAPIIKSHKASENSAIKLTMRPG
jgi:hypothetical protein